MSVGTAPPSIMRLERETLLFAGLRQYANLCTLVHHSILSITSAKAETKSKMSRIRSLCSCMIAPKNIFLCISLFFVDTNTLDKELNIFANV